VSDFYLTHGDENYPKNNGGVSAPTCEQDALATAGKPALSEVEGLRRYENPVRPDYSEFRKVISWLRC